MGWPAITPVSPPKRGYATERSETSAGFEENDINDAKVGPVLLVVAWLEETFREVITCLVVEDFCTGCDEVDWEVSTVIVVSLDGVLVNEGTEVSNGWVVAEPEDRLLVNEGTEVNNGWVVAELEDTCSTGFDKPNVG